MTDATEKTSDEQVIEEVRKWAEMYAKEHGWVINPDPKTLRTVLRGLARNRARVGERYCPCRLRTGDREKDRDIICPCIYHKDEISGQGHCHCHLFFQKKAEEMSNFS